MRFTFTDPSPADAEVYGNVRFSRIDRDGSKPCVKAWRGRAQKPYAHYSFRSTEQREVWIEEARAGEDMTKKFKAERKDADAKNQATERAETKVGTIVYTSWGYDQTNINFYEVVERPTAASAVVREIGCRVGEATGPFSQQVRPAPGCFVGPPVRKVIGPWGMKFGQSAGHGYRTSADRSVHSSWGH